MNTIYLLQGDYAQTQATLRQLSGLLTEHDAVMLFGEAILAWLDLDIRFKQPIYILDEEYIYVQKLDNLSLKMISFDELADLILAYQQCVRLQ
ncbi:hypothetical protein [Moraxella sp. ZY210820]|uniref:hypothetical protein n=1 Tax=unclassified Moraxella TaxID=2685852 RepID=UPI0027312095|nr:hypothetical protein [Moraxella sp. ZY210820]WLF83051.1 hypothetical protein LU301_07150 [Moraxella sp. ZY210820]